MTTFAAYGRGLSPAVLDALVELEMFIGDVDGETIDGGVIDAKEAVEAFNTIVAALSAGQSPAQTDKQQ